ncbi:hypothetical protein O6H91_21G037700 [Diphasiastrum complanatum]|uniref:Uncharacterized protein n=1 Tax=Diphasiastrum complanatum TaxID=34168 RepID=A0ACC2AJG3_DIPCM|nr:hypothetical protein O6H91_21G037700 [Diphasiastrum complanatum]
MVQFQKPKKVYSDRRVYPGGGAAPADNFVPVPTVNVTAGAHERRSGRSRPIDGRGGYMAFGPVANGLHKPAVPPHGSFSQNRMLLPPYPGGPLTQPYSIPSRGGVHGPVGGIPHGPQAGSRGFGAGRGSTGGPIGGHLAHHQASQPLGGIGAGFNFGGLENPASQSSVGGPMTQQGLMTQIPTQGLSQSLRDSFSLGACHRISWGTILSLKDHMLLTRVLNFQPRHHREVTEWTSFRMELKVLLWETS